MTNFGYNHILAILYNLHKEHLSIIEMLLTHCNVDEEKIKKYIDEIDKEFKTSMVIDK